MLMYLLILLAAPLPPEKKPEDDKTKLQGTWLVVEMQKGGRKLSGDDVQVKSFNFDGDNLTVSRGDIMLPAAFKLDAKQKPPHIDVEPKDLGYALKLLYKLDGDNLTIYGAESERGDRPDNYEAARLIITLKREKK